MFWVSNGGKRIAVEVGRCRAMRNGALLPGWKFLKEQRISDMFWRLNNVIRKWILFQPNQDWGDTGFVLVIWMLFYFDCIVFLIKFENFRFLFIHSLILRYFVLFQCQFSNNRRWRSRQPIRRLMHFRCIFVWGNYLFFLKHRFPGQYYDHEGFGGIPVCTECVVLFQFSFMFVYSFM